ncbi:MULTISPECIES: TIGR04086 family membrane protein [Bacillaceae]|uniref:TIGR04086 family membrane protein n=1 Tax=Bacillaceae TaxID=186817 RepID=UPI001E51A23A|nr:MULTISPECIES: TIGR04086 family membrane protein [Bacillaceae]MCE4046909.1 TIGR04086 family membrane protein [Bacillus sp. Au-Bac7]MCM3030012.1 TIGR04086 family membrane protein [Niallia sp. MER 6]MDL0436306.1 TIGR04086 family membrane protein [Niallia sp. SS-2023]UPO89605.1 TIGR04086 family membrane protein [Niallia sp. Man26]
MEESKNVGSAVLYGLIAIFTLFITSSIVFSLLLRFTSLQEASLQYIITAVSFITLFAGGFISGGKGKQKGWFLGGITGLIYFLIVFLFSFLGLDQLFTFEQFIYHVCYTLIAMMGGILGVNLSKS